MKVPTRKLIRRMNHKLLVRVTAEPMCSPIGVIAMSAPSVNSPMPTVSRIEPKTKASSAPAGTGTSAKQTTNTIAVIGRTDFKASSIFAKRIVLFNPNLFSIHQNRAINVVRINWSSARSPFVGIGRLLPNPAGPPRKITADRLIAKHPVLSITYC